MAEWIIKVYQDEKYFCDFLDWREQMPVKAKARMDNILDFLEVTKNWTNIPYIKPIKGYDGIFELRFIVSNIQYRPLGCYGPEEKTFILLIGATEQGNEFNPRNAPWKATKRKNRIFKNRRYVRELY